MKMGYSIQIKEADEITWQERVFVVHSPAHARQQSAGLDIRLTKAKEKLEKLASFKSTLHFF